MSQNTDTASAIPTTSNLYLGDCLNVMPTLAPANVAMFFADLPYATADRKTTANEWDIVFDLELYWKITSTIKKKDAVHIMTGTQPFVSALIASNIKDFRYDLIWRKTLPTGHLNSHHRPMRAHEHMCIFFTYRGTYNAQMTTAKRNQGNNARSRSGKSSNWGSVSENRESWKDNGTRMPVSVIDVPSEKRNNLKHPTQKPVALLEWLIKTYTNPGDTVLDPTFGSCTTGLACARLGRNFIGIEKDAEYFRIGRERVDAERRNLSLTPSEVHQ